MEEITLSSVPDEELQAIKTAEKGRISLPQGLAPD